MRALVTGAAGFIGSTLVDALLADGHDVRGVDGFIPFYDEAQKRSNLTEAGRAQRFDLVEADLRGADLTPLLAGVDVVFHLAAQAGVRPSWAEGFGDYVSHNVLATQRLLEAIRGSAVGRVVFASSSSVYGEASSYPTDEQDLPRPHSPYGVTKLAGEHLCGLYGANYGVPVTSLRCFTVYGPRQRPDMAVYRMIEAGLSGAPFPLLGTGDQQREFTYVGDVVEATLRAGRADLEPGTVLNVAGGSSTRVVDLIKVVEEALGSGVPIEQDPAALGDVTRTGGAIERAGVLLDWRPQVELAEGVADQLAWHRARRAVAGRA